MPPSDTMDPPSGETRRRPRQLREENNNQDTDHLDLDAGGAPTPEEALAHLREQLEGETARRSDAEARAQAASRARDESDQRASRAEQVVVERTTASLESAIQSQTQRRQSATNALRIARETGDIEAEIAAQGELSESATTLAMLNADKARMASAPRPEPRQQPARQAAPSPEAQAWIDAHPRFRSDPDYYDDAISSHNKALRAGYRDGSAEYVQFIDRRMAELYPDGDRGRMSQGNGNTRRPASSFAAPPSRGGDQYRDRGTNQSDLIRRVGGPDATMEDMIQFAEINGFLKSDKTPDVERYLKAQQQILDERRSGRATGLTRSDEESLR